MNPQPTQDAMECAEAIIKRINEAVFNVPVKPLEEGEIARLIDTRTNLPALTVVAMAAQGVVDAHEKSGPWAKPGKIIADIAGPLSEVRNALAALPKSK